MPRDHQQVDIAALVVSTLALLFTIGSFWWMHARVGTLRAFRPRTFSGYVEAEQSAIRLPILLFNTGPTSIVVTGMRLRFSDATTEKPMEWEWTRTTIDPGENDIRDVASPFSVQGRNTYSLAAEFVGVYPGAIPEPRAYTVTLEALTSKADAWLRVISFQFQAGNLRHPSNYITYSNDPEYLTDEERAEATEALNALRAKAAPVT